MAFNPINIFPNDLRPRRAIGVNLPFNGPAVFISNYQTKDAVRNNIINFFLTNPNERIGNPSFGAGLRNFIFTQITNNNLDFLKEDIQSKIINNFPRVSLKSIQIIPEADINTITVKITYSILGTNINDNLELNFS
jgi:phage baseplate assembly protein W